MSHVFLTDCNFKKYYTCKTIFHLLYFLLLSLKLKIEFREIWMHNNYDEIKIIMKNNN